MRAQSINFERGRNSKISLDIGIIRSIDNNDLYLLDFGWDYELQSFDEKEFQKEYSFNNDIEENSKADFERAKAVAKALEEQIIMHHKFFDWKEKGNFYAFLKSDPYPEYPYIYDATPLMDEWRLVFSKIALSNMEKIDANNL